jgi:hypothetical protein
MVVRFPFCRGSENSAVCRGGLPWPLVVRQALPSVSSLRSAHPRETGVASDAPSNKPLMEAHEKMMREVASPLTGDPDVAFVQGVIPHHQGAIDMGKIEPQYGKNPDPGSSWKHHHYRAGRGERRNADLAEEKQKVIRAVFVQNAARSPRA